MSFQFSDKEEDPSHMCYNNNTSPFSLQPPATSSVPTNTSWTTRHGLPVASETQWLDPRLIDPRLLNPQPEAGVALAGSGFTYRDSEFTFGSASTNTPAMAGAQFSPINAPWPDSRANHSGNRRSAISSLLPPMLGALGAPAYKGDDEDDKEGMVVVEEEEDDYQPRRHAGRVMKKLLALPKLRSRLPLRKGVTLPAYIDDEREAAAVASLRGRISNQPCEKCKNGGGPFEGCIVVDGFFSSACCNCKWDHFVRQCAMHDPKLFKERKGASKPTPLPRQPNQPRLQGMNWKGIIEQAEAEKQWEVNELLAKIEEQLWLASLSTEHVEKLRKLL